MCIVHNLCIDHPEIFLSLFLFCCYCFYKGRDPPHIKSQTCRVLGEILPSVSKMNKASRDFTSSVLPPLVTDLIKADAAVSSTMFRISSLKVKVYMQTYSCESFVVVETGLTEVLSAMSGNFSVNANFIEGLERKSARSFS